MLNRINQRAGLVAPLNLAGPCNQALTQQANASIRTAETLARRSSCAQSRHDSVALAMGAGLVKGWGGALNRVGALTHRLVGSADSHEVPANAPRDIVAETRAQLASDPWKFGILGQASIRFADQLAHVATAVGCSPPVARAVQGGCLGVAALACQAGALVGLVVRVAAAMVASLAVMVASGARAAVTWSPLAWGTTPQVARGWRAALAEDFESTASSAEPNARKLREFVTDVLRAQPGDVTVDGVDLAAGPFDSDTQRADAALAQLARVCNGDERSQATLAWLLSQQSGAFLLQHVRPVTLRGRPQHAMTVGSCRYTYDVQPQNDGLRVSLTYALTPVALCEEWGGRKTLCSHDSQVAYCADLLLRPARDAAAEPTVELLDAGVVGKIGLLPAGATPSLAQEALP